MTPDNISLLYHLASKGKTVRDAESQSHSENFYMICEMAQTLLHIRAEQTHGLTIPIYPGKVKLPADILRPMVNPAASNEVAKTVYLPPEAAGWLREMYKPKPVGTKEKKERKPGVKRKALATNGHTKRARKRRKSDQDDEDDDEQSLSGTSDVEMPDELEEPLGSEDDADNDGGEEKLGRGARGRAKAKARRQAAKARKRDKEKSPRPGGSSTG